MHIFAIKNLMLFYGNTCPGCFQKYVGKADTNLITRLDEHGTKVDQPMHLMTVLCYLHFQMQLLIPPSSAKNYTLIMP